MFFDKNLKNTLRAKTSAALKTVLLKNNELHELDELCLALGEMNWLTAMAVSRRRFRGLSL